MARRSSSLIDDLILAPWWISAALAPIAYFVFAAVIPGAVGHTGASGIAPAMMATLASSVAPYAFWGLLLISAVSAIRGWVLGKQFDRQKSVESLRNLPWKQFEDLVGEYFRRSGYDVSETLGGGADDGVDLKLGAYGTTTLVQCKRWKNKKVGVPIVRELLGAITAHRADNGIVVTTTEFTEDARDFARKHGVQLIAGSELLDAIRPLQPAGQLAEPPALEFTLDDPPPCPRCGGEMVRRTARKGSNAGNQFWGCRSFPRCRGTAKIDS